MRQLIEIVFEGLTSEQAAELCCRLGGAQAAKLLEEIEHKSDGVAEMALEGLPISETTMLAGVHLRLLRYEPGPLDVELSFELEDVRGAQGMNFQRSLRDFSKAAAEAVGVVTYFAGLEPAVDEKTRLFTGPELGPIHLRHP